MRLRRSRVGRRGRYVAIGLAAALAAVAIADELSSPMTAAPPGQTSASGFAVYLDPDGRPMVPGPDTPRIALPDRASGGGAAAPTITDAPGGGRMVRLRGRVFAASVAHVADDGRVLIECVGDSGRSTRAEDSANAGLPLLPEPR